MYIRVLSDLHLEVGGRARFEPISLKTDSDTVLVLAGDIDIGTNAADFARRVSKRFRAVVAVPGNHEFYNGSLPRTLEKIRARLAEPGCDNVYFLENESVTIGNTRFIGATLWTDFDGGNGEFMHAARTKMNDFRKIRTGGHAAPYARRFRPIDALARHHQSRQYLFEEVRAARAAGQLTVIVTHHAPSFRFIPPVERTRSIDLSAAYASALDDQISAEGPDYWFFGHVHACWDSRIGDTRLLSNPRGYLPSEPVEEFDPSLRISLPASSRTYIG